VAGLLENAGVAPDNRPAFGFAGALVVVGGLLTAAGVTDGIVGRAIGESPGWFFAALLLALFGGLLGTVAALFVDSDEQEPKEHGLLLLGNLCLFVGLVLALWGTVEVWSNTRAPSLTTATSSAGGATVLDVKVEDSGLDSKEHVALIVERVKGGRGYGARLHSAWLGSNEEGKVEHETKVRVPPHVTGKIGVWAFVGDGSDNCYAERGDNDACVVMTIPHAREALQLKVDWRKGRKALEGSLTARNVARDAVHMRAVGQVRGDPHTNRLMARWRLGSDANGHFERTFTIHGTARFTWVCIVARTGPVRRCPPPMEHRGKAVWARYRVPDVKPDAGPQLSR
jgi:hypothetical protein